MKGPLRHYSVGTRGQQPLSNRNVLKLQHSMHQHLRGGGTCTVVIAENYVLVVDGPKLCAGLTNLDKRHKRTSIGVGKRVVSDTGGAAVQA